MQCQNIVAHAREPQDVGRLDDARCIRRTERRPQLNVESCEQVNPELTTVDFD
jgi:hypothetical protein